MNYRYRPKGAASLFRGAFDYDLDITVYKPASVTDYGNETLDWSVPIKVGVYKQAGLIDAFAGLKRPTVEILSRAGLQARQGLHVLFCLPKVPLSPKSSRVLISKQSYEVVYTIESFRTHQAFVIEEV